MDALVMAGGKASPEFTGATGATNRALVEIAPGRTMLDFVVDALSEAKSIGRLFVVGDIPQNDNYTVIAPGESLMDNLVIGIKAMGHQAGNRVLLVSSDIPFITGEAVDDFVANADQLGAGFCYPIIPMDAYNRHFAGMKRTTLRLREGEFTGGNVILVDPSFLLQNEAAVRGAYAARKSVLKLGSLLGWGLLLRIVLSQTIASNLLCVADLEAGVGRLLGGAAARAIVTEYASLGTDVDKVEDVEIARKMLTQR
ncbi:MAG TPA: NTP transferase domain-containing protein [Capsulimonadaceae bacterium]|nr:NTP transferase domain-containing protein [Capsulimonadaceae bacterium]